MNQNIINYEFKAPSGSIKVSKSGWKFVPSLDVEKNKYLDKMHELTDTDIEELSVDSDARRYKRKPKYSLYEKEES